MSCGQNLRPGPLPPQVNIEMNAEHSLNEQESKIVVDVGYKLAATYKQGEPVTGECLWAVVTFRVTYSLSSFAELSEPQFKAFAYMNGIYNTWPFWRELLHSMLSRMGLPTLMLLVYSPEVWRSRIWRR